MGSWLGGSGSGEWENAKQRQGGFGGTLQYVEAQLQEADDVARGRQRVLALLVGALHKPRGGIAHRAQQPILLLARLQVHTFGVGSPESAEGRLHLMDGVAGKLQKAIRRVVASNGYGGEPEAEVIAE